MTVTTPIVVAAGAVCWRLDKGRMRILLIHRGDRTDVSLPKGKVDQGETLPETAVREIAEETGFIVTLGAPLGTSEYPLPSGRGKIVHYWVAEVHDEVMADHSFSPNAEVAALEWVSPKQAKAKLSYERDREVIDLFIERADANRLRTFAIIAFRHGKAVPAGSWSGPDSTRPLERVGVDQARASAKAIAAYAPAKLISSTAARCMSTIEPVATLLGLDVKATAAISQDAWEDGIAEVGRVVAKRIEKRVTAVLCSHGPVLPEILAEIGHIAGSGSKSEFRRASMLDTGEFAVVHLAVADPTGGVIAVETHSPTFD